MNKETLPTYGEIAYKIWMDNQVQYDSVWETMAQAVIDEYKKRNGLEISSPSQEEQHPVPPPYQKSRFAIIYSETDPTVSFKAALNQLQNAKSENTHIAFIEATLQHINWQSSYTNPDVICRMFDHGTWKSIVTYFVDLNLPSATSFLHDKWLLLFSNKEETKNPFIILLHII